MRCEREREGMPLLVRGARRLSSCVDICKEKNIYAAIFFNLCLSQLSFLVAAEQSFSMCEDHACKFVCNCQSQIFVFFCFHYRCRH